MVSACDLSVAEYNSSGHKYLNALFAGIGTPKLCDFLNLFSIDLDEIACFSLLSALAEHSPNDALLHPAVTVREVSTSVLPNAFRSLPLRPK